MLELDFPYVTTFVSAFMAFVLGMIWYHPKVMGKAWMEARGKDSGQSEMNGPLPFVFSFMLWLVAATFYSFLAQLHDVDTIQGLLCLSSLLWVAFAMPPTLMGAFYTGYPFKAVSIDSSFQLAGYYILALVHVLDGYFPNLAGI